ncbi:MAG: helix-turn-helix domain-containing protein [Clostridiales bacterium]|nr:helix-turn-helix domain-containing protein [Clostridiales bacterium]
MSNFGERLKQIRKDKHLTQEELAKICGISSVFIRYIEKGRSIPNIDLLVDLCNYFNVTPEYLLQDSLKITGNKDEKSEIIKFMDKLTPKQLQFFMEWCSVAGKYMVDEDNTDPN